MIADEEIVLLTENLHWLTRDQAWHYRILPKEHDNEGYTIYYLEQLDAAELSAELEILLGKPVKLVPLAEPQVNKLLSKYYLRQENAAEQQPPSGEPVVDDFLNKLIREAEFHKSSDIHIEAYERKCRVRIRIDGLLVERYLIHSEDYPPLINKIKIAAGLDIAEKRLPQDGRIGFEYGELKFDIRVSVLPTLYGEKVVLRMLNNDVTKIDLNELGFSTPDLRNYLEGVRRPEGILLISGPTGSGKTTTLYATLKRLNVESRNIMTIEDPIEYTLEGVNQVQQKESIGLTFSAALRTFLRQDPDVIMVGEIRDKETASMAIRAALTGHLVLSTIHTNSAWGTISRLIDMGIPPYLIANTLNTTVAQRLVRLLCPDCKTEQIFDADAYPRQFIAPALVERHFLPAGCNQCFFTGFKGRKAVYEVIPIDQELAVEIRNGNAYIQDLLREKGIGTLAGNAFELFQSGYTALEEIYPLLLNF